MKKLFSLLLFMFCWSLLANGQEGVEIISTKKVHKTKEKKYDPSKLVDTITIYGIDTIVAHETLRKDFKSVVSINKNDLLLYNGAPYTAKSLKQTLSKNHRDSIRAYKNWWISILGGPSYTPEASMGIGGAALMTFLTDRDNPNLKRSFIPIGFNLSVNGTFVLAGISCIYLENNNFRIYTNYGFRMEPASFYGIGYAEIDAPKKEEDVKYDKQTIFLKPIFLWNVWEGKLFLGPLLDITYNYGSNMSDYIKENASVQRYGTHFTNIGLGFSAQYDTRDDESFPLNGIYAIFKGTAYTTYTLNRYNYGYISTEFRHYIQLFNRRSTFAYTLKLENSMGSVPYTSLPTFGGAFNLRGYISDKYRDKNMGYVMGEYRHMFGTAEQHARRTLGSRIGAVAWVGAGSIAHQMRDMKQWSINYGVGLRYEIQPNKNFRIDVGRGSGKQNGWLLYLNMIEAF